MVTAASLAKKNVIDIGKKDFNSLLILPPPETSQVMAAQTMKLFSTNGIVPDWLTDRFRSWRRDTEPVRCKGNKDDRYRFKNQNDAFNGMLPDYLIKAKGEIDALKQVTGKFETEIDKRKDKIVRILDTLVSRASTRFKMAYQPYHLNPCNDKAYNKMVEIYQELLEIQAKVDRIIDIAILQLAFAGEDKDAIIKALDNVQSLIEKML